jgi:hypothetical protein
MLEAQAASKNLGTKTDALMTQLHHTHRNHAEDEEQDNSSHALPSSHNGQKSNAKFMQKLA